MNPRISPWKYKITTAMAHIWGRLYKAPQPRIVILSYHSVHPTRIFRSCKPDMFEAHLQWLKENCDIIPLSSLFPIQFKDTPNAKPKVVITFDDGYVDNYQYAFPLLVKWGVPATFFATVGLLERHPEVMQRFQYFRHTGMEELEPLTWKQVQEMTDAGMEFGAHTYSHPNLIYLEKPQLEFEIKEAKERMEDKIGQRVDGFAYPFGRPRCHFNNVNLDMVRRAGYKYAVAVFFRGVLTRDSQWALPRFSSNNDDVRTLADKIKGSWDFVGYFQEWAPLWVGRVISPRAFRASAYGPQYVPNRYHSDARRVDGIETSL
ncbi:polysaccharide deacetylase family protein [bacterium]|nr:polysaccharide deacetylase family protein [bacterium]